MFVTNLCICLREDEVERFNVLHKGTGFHYRPIRHVIILVFYLNVVITKQYTSEILNAVLCLGII